MRAVGIRERVLSLTDPGGLRVRDSVVEGRLDLSAFSVGAPLVFERCTFEEAPDLEGADLHSVAFVDCTLPGLLANGVRVRRDINLSGSTIAGAHRTDVSVGRTAAVWLSEAFVGGRLLCVGTRIDGLGDRAVQADRIEIGGSARFMGGFEATGELRFLGARIAGSVEFYGSKVVHPSGPAFQLSDAEIRGALFVIDAVIDGQLRLRSTRILGACSFRAAEVRSAVEAAVDGTRLSVGGDLTLEGGTVIVGEISAPAADLGGLAVASSAQLSNPGGRALDLTDVEVRARCLFGAGLVVRGRISMPRGHIRGRLLMKDVELTDPQRGVLFDGYGLVVDGNVELPGLVARGGRLVFVSLGCRRFDATGAQLEVVDEVALDLSAASVQGDVDLQGPFRATDAVRLTGASIAGWLRAEGADLAHLSAVSATFGQGMELLWKACGGVNLNGSTTSTLLLAPDEWPDGAWIAGFTYDRIEIGKDYRWDGGAVPDWLDRAEFDAGAYEHAARVFKQHGYGAQAEHILIRGRDEASRLGMRNDLSGDSRWRRVVAPARRAGDWLYGRTVGYGYRPGRALFALAALLIAVLALVGGMAGPLRATDAQGQVVTVNECTGGRVRCFSPVFYTVDTVVPLVSLNQRATWYPDTRARHGTLLDVLLDLATLLGWILSTIVVLSFARLARTS